MPKNKKIAAVVGVLVVLMLPVLISSRYILQSIIMVALYAYWACCWNIVSGFGGSLSLGHAVYIGIGAYVTTILFKMGLTPWLGMLIGGLLAGLLSLVIGYPCFRLKGSYFTLSTIALLHIVRLLVTSNDYVFGFQVNGAQGLQVPWKGGGFWDMQFIDKRWYLYIILGFLALILFISHWISQSKMGYYLAAINTNQEAANSLGVNVMAVKLKSIFISAFFTAIGGAFYAQLILFLDPQRILGYELSSEIMFFAVIGGVGTVWGPMIGAILLVPVNEITRIFFGTRLTGLAPLLYGVVFMLVVYFMPEGVYKYLRLLWNKIFGGLHSSTKPSDKPQKVS